MPTRVPSRAAVLTALALTAAATHAAPFTYQGRLNQTGTPATGTFDIVVELHNASTGGAPIATDSFEDIQVTGGLFTLPIDFGPGFPNADARWLDIAVRPGSSTGGFQTLPRQFIDAAPFAAVDLNEPWAVTPGPTARAAFGDGNDIVLINRTNRIGAEFFGIGAQTDGFGGMYIDTNAQGEPFYGYSTAGSIQAYHYYDPTTDALRVYMDGDRIAIDAEGARVNGNLGVTGTVTFEPDADFTFFTADPTRDLFTFGSGSFFGVREVFVQVFGDMAARSLSLVDGVSADEVTASVVRSNSFEYASDRFRTLALPAASFRLSASGVGFGYDTATGAVFSSTPGSTVGFVAPVHLPQAAEITSVTVVVRNTVGRFIQARLERQVPGSAPSFLSLVSSGSSGTSVNLSDSTINNGTVNNANGALLLIVAVGAPGWTGNLDTAILGAFIDYTVTSPD